MKRSNTCNDCIYWKKLTTSNGSPYACHFLLETGQRRRKDTKGACIEFKKKSLG